MKTKYIKTFSEFINENMNSNTNNFDEFIENKNSELYDNIEDFRNINDIITNNYDAIKRNLNAINQLISTTGCSIDFVLNWQLEAFSPEYVYIPLNIPGDELRGDDGWTSNSLGISLRNLLGNIDTAKFDLYLAPSYEAKTYEIDPEIIDTQKYFDINADAPTLVKVLKEEVLPLVAKITNPSSQWYEEFSRDKGWAYHLPEVSFDLETSTWSN